MAPIRIWHQSFTVLGDLPDYRRMLGERIRKVVRPDTEVVLHGQIPGTYSSNYPGTDIRYRAIVWLHGLQWITAALEADPGNAEAAYERGRLLALIGEPARAVADFTAAILSRPDFGRAYVGRAEAKLTLKDGKSAIADFDRAIEVAPGDADVHVARATFRLRIGNLPGARADLVAARAVADPATAARIDVMLTKLGGG